MGEIIAISHIDKKIILMKAEGMTSKQICDKVDLTKEAIDKRISRLIDKFRCESILHLYKTMKEQGYI